MARSDKSENQHYVPRMLLKNFTLSKAEQVHAFDKRESRSFRTNIRNVASERNFYRFAFGEHEGTIEPELSRMETAADNALRKVVESSSLGTLSAEERTWLGVFVAAQHVRGRGFREMTRGFDDKLKQKVLDMGGDLSKVEGWKPFNSEQDLQHFSIFFLMRSIPDFSLMMNAKVWVLMQTKKSNPFWISDTPVTMHNQTDMGPFGNIGLGVPGIQIHMPLTSTLTLALWCPTIIEGMQTDVDKAKKSHQDLRYKRLFGFGYDRHLLDDGIARFDSVIGNHDEMMAKIGEGKPLSSQCRRADRRRRPWDHPHGASPACNR